MRAKQGGNRKQQPVLEGQQVLVELLDTLSITTITQTYLNPGKQNIKAAFAFSLPVDAVLLEMTVTLGDKMLKGTVLPGLEFEELLDKFIFVVDGDMPIRLQNHRSGTYSMNGGNLPPGEKAVISFCYGMFQPWQGDTLRYYLPSTIAPRYGSVEHADLEEQYQEPKTSLLADNLFSFCMTIRSKAADLLIESPSHSITVERTQTIGERLVTLNQKVAFMDRDLIITVQKSAQQTATAWLVKDGDEYLVWASFQPHFNLAEDTTPHSVKIVVDCSDSMAGNSIDQAREALLRVLDELRPQDWFNIIAFGKRPTPLFNVQAKVTTESLAFARSYLRKLDANMGGTDTWNAMEMAVQLRCPEKIQQDILLITDGEIDGWEEIVAEVKKDKHRFFTVGVGNAVSGEFVLSLAERTGGACELVLPDENMAERIHRHFKRIGLPCSSNSQLIWPIAPARTFPEEVQSIYDGDTCNLFAWFDQPPAGELLLRINLPDGSTQTISASLDQPPQDNNENGVIARMAAALKLRELTDEETGQELALKYQLVSELTNYLIIVQRKEEDKADILQELYKMPQRMAGFVRRARLRRAASQKEQMAEQMSEADTGDYYPPTHFQCFSYDTESVNLRCWSVQELKMMKQMSEAGMDYDPHTFHRDNPDFRVEESVNIVDFIKSKAYDAIVAKRQASNGEVETNVTVWVWDIVEDKKINRFVTLLDEMLTVVTMPSGINLPLLPGSIFELLENIVAEGFPEQTVVTLFLYYFSGSRTGEDCFSRQSQLVIQKAYKQLQPDSATETLVKERLTMQKPQIMSLT